jgi:hypothetical protein
MQSFMTTAGMINIVNGVLAGVFAGLAMKAVFGSTPASCTIFGASIFGVTVALWRWYQVQTWTKAERSLTVRFPSHK